MKHHASAPPALLLIAALLACSGGAETATERTTAPAPAEPAIAAKAEPAGPIALETPNSPPDFEIPHYRAVGIGQEVGFGLEVIDEDQDDVRVELVQKPAGATYDPITLTVVFKPTRRDYPVAPFLVKITEMQRKTGKQRVFLHPFAIEVSRRRVPKPTAGPLSPEVETLITIHDPERLKLANRRWPLHKMLEWSARSKLLDHPETKVEEPDGRVFYQDVLVGLAKANDNPTVHPKTGAFDKRTFGDPRSWELITVRPRVDKKWHEMRLVYKSTRSHAPVYVMFKIRPTSDEKLPPEAREYNNKIFSKYLVEAFFDAEGNLDPELMTNKRKHAARVVQFMESIMNHKEEGKPWAHGTFLGLPSEARLGGGSKRNAEGEYESGDGWAWNVFKVKPKDGRLTFQNVPIKGFATDVEPGEGEWKMACAPRFDPDHAARDPRYTPLCRKSGHVDLPATGDGYRDSDGVSDAKITSSFVDAANMFRGFKDEMMTAQLPLRDPRRDLFEEKGMTCSQCHTRKFGVRNMYDRSAYDPSAGVPKVANKSQATTFFVIVPTESWQPYAVDFQHKQECKFKKNIESELGIKTSLSCPLMADQ